MDRLAFHVCAGVMIIGLAGCGQDNSAPANEEAVPPATVEEDMGMDVAPSAEEGAAAEADEMLPNSETVVEPNPTSALSFDRDDTGEDLYQRGFYQDAITRWEEDAEAGDGYAAFRLGVEYFDAHHVARDIELSARYHQLGAELGNPAAMFEIASFYEAGLGVEADVTRAAEWYLASARHGYPPAQHNVATMFEEGAGVEEDLIQAYHFYDLAISNGFRVNFEFSDELGESVFVDPRLRLRSMMTEEDVAAAEALSEGFEPLP